MTVVIAGADGDVNGDDVVGVGGINVAGRGGTGSDMGVDGRGRTGTDGRGR